MENKQKEDIFKDLLQSCFVPVLKQDLDSAPIQRDNFDDYRQALEQTIPLLYDFIQQQEHLIFNNEDWQEMQGSLIILLCEVTAHGYENPYKLNNSNLLENANKILRRQDHLETAINQIVFTHYQKRLRQNTWKKELGTVHGFVRFLETFYDLKSEETKTMPMNWLSFCLSVGICVRDCHEPAYKQISTKIFYTMLRCGQPDDIRSINIHSVIYDSIIKDIYQLECVTTTEENWKCLCKCLDFYEDLDSLSWSRVDDMIEVLLRSINLCSVGLVTASLVKYITNLCCYFAINSREIKIVCNTDWSTEGNLKECRTLCGSNSSFTIFRWAKSILNMFIAESYKLLLSENVCHQLLLEFHRCFLVSILPIALPIIETHLADFYNKFTKELMKAIATHTDDKKVVLLVRQMVETFYLQLLHSPQCQSNERLLKYRNAYEQLLQHKKFIENI